MAQTELLYCSEKYHINPHPKLLYFLKWHHHPLPGCLGPQSGNSIFLSSSHAFHPADYSALKSIQNAAHHQHCCSPAPGKLLAGLPASKHSSHPHSSQQRRDLSAVLSDITSFPIKPSNGFLRAKSKRLTSAQRPCIFWTPFLSPSSSPSSPTSWYTDHLPIPPSVKPTWC